MEKLLGEIMIDLKQYIEESLLDDFDTLVSNQDKIFKQPFVTLYRDAKRVGWETPVDLFDQTISTYGKKVSSIPKLSKGEVYVGFYFDPWSPNLKKIYVKFNNSDFQVFKKSQGRSSKRYKDPSLTITPFKHNGRYEPSIMPAQNVDLNKIKCGYLLGEEHATDALRMLALLSEYKWNENNW